MSSCAGLDTDLPEQRLHSSEAAKPSALGRAVERQRGRLTRARGRRELQTADSCTRTAQRLYAHGLAAAAAAHAAGAGGRVLPPSIHAAARGGDDSATAVLAVLAGAFGVLKALRRAPPCPPTAAGLPPARLAGALARTRRDSLARRSARPAARPAAAAAQLAALLQHFRGQVEAEAGAEGEAGGAGGAAALAAARNQPPGPRLQLLFAPSALSLPRRRRRRATAYSMG